MATEKFCLRWNDFESNISGAFRELREDKDFFDVTLACDDEQIQAHKVILSACSSFFRTVLRRNPHAHPLLYLKGVKYTDLQSVLNFMYHGEVNVAQEELNSFLAVAEELKVKGLTQSQSGGAAETNHRKQSYQEPPREPPAPKRPRQEAPRAPVAPPRIEVDVEVQEVAMPQPIVKVEPPAPQYGGEQSLAPYQGEEQYEEDYGGYEESAGYETGGVVAQGQKGNNIPTCTWEMYQFSSFSMVPFPQKALTLNLVHVPILTIQINLTNGIIHQI